MNDKLITTAPELEGIEPSKAKQIKETFQPMTEMLGEFEEAYANVLKEAEAEVTKEVTAKAKRLRLDIAKVRHATEKERKAQKEEYLRAGKAIDGVSNILKWAVAEKEEKLKEIEDHFEAIERDRITAIQAERVEALSKYVDDAEGRDLASMEDDVWSAYLASKKKELEDRLAAEKKAEEERIAKEKAEAEERVRIKKENEKLKVEAAERERLQKIEDEKRAKAKAERLAKEEAEAKARAEKEKKQREAHEKQLREEREERARIEREEREKREKLEAELRAKEEAETKAKAEAEQLIQDELGKGDEAKMADLVKELSELRSKYTFKSEKNKNIYVEVGKLLDAAATLMLKSQAEGKR